MSKTIIIGGLLAALATGGAVALGHRATRTPPPPEVAAPPATDTPQAALPVAPPVPAVVTPTPTRVAPPAPAPAATRPPIAPPAAPATQFVVRSPERWAEFQSLVVESFGAADGARYITIYSDLCVELQDRTAHPGPDHQQVEMIMDAIMDASRRLKEELPDVHKQLRDTEERMRLALPWLGACLGEDAYKQITDGLGPDQSTPDFTRGKNQ